MKVCMFVYNSCKHDARVLKEAQTLAKAGYDVRIIAVLSDDTRPYEERDGFRIIRVIKDPVHYRILRGVKYFSPAIALKSMLQTMVKKALLLPVLGLASFLSRVYSRLKLASDNIRSALPTHYRLRGTFAQAFQEIVERVKEKGLRRYLKEALKSPRNVPLVGWPFLLGFCVYRGLRKALYWGVRRPARIVWYRYVKRALYWGVRRPARIVRSFLYRKLRNFLLIFHKPLTYLDYYKRSLAVIKEEPADIYHAHDLNTLPVAYWATRRYGGKLVYDSHELYTETSNLSHTERMVFRFLEGFLIRRCQAVITVNHSIARELADRYRIELPIVIMNCPMLLNSTRSTDFLRAKLGIRKEDALVLYQGGFSPHRGLENLIAAIAMLPAVKLVMMGWGRLEEDLRALADAMGLIGKRVFFLPPVPQNELLLWTSSADVGVIPYRNVGLNNYYSLPNKLFEYIAAGIPVVASDLPELRLVIEEFQVGCTFNPDDPKDIARAITWVLEDEQRLAKLKENARKAAAVLNWENEEKKLLELYRKLTS